MSASRLANKPSTPRGLGILVHFNRWEQRVYAVATNKVDMFATVQRVKLLNFEKTEVYKRYIMRKNVNKHIQPMLGCWDPNNMLIHSLEIWKSWAWMFEYEKGLQGRRWERRESKIKKRKICWVHLFHWVFSRHFVWEFLLTNHQSWWGLLIDFLSLLRNPLFFSSVILIRFSHHFGRNKTKENSTKVYNLTNLWNTH